MTTRTRTLLEREILLVSRACARETKRIKEAGSRPGAEQGLVK
jgi:hypothetical protein